MELCSHDLRSERTEAERLGARYTGSGLIDRADARKRTITVDILTFFALASGPSAETEKFLRNW